MKSSDIGNVLVMVTAFFWVFFSGFMIGRFWNQKSTIHEAGEPIIQTGSNHLPANFGAIMKELAKETPGKTVFTFEEINHRAKTFQTQ